MTILSSPTQVELSGRGLVTIRPSDYVATGGEGSVYRLNDTIVKLYTDPQKMTEAGFLEKLKLLATIKHNQIVAPKGLVTRSGVEIGYYMPYVSGEPLSRIFTNDFIARNGITQADAIEVVHSMREVILAAHRHKAVLVDANELNWLLELKKKKLPIPYVIDVDSWSIGKWKGSVIMPSIRDWHAKEFNELTDWFAWGVVTFQIFTGVHPYKGVMEGYERGNLVARMKANASVFTPGVRLSHAVRDFSRIPKGLLAWYEAVFKRGERLPPPAKFDVVSSLASTGQMYRLAVKATGKLSYTKLYSSGVDSVVKVFQSGVLASSSGKLIDLDSKKEVGTFTSNAVELIEIDGGYIFADFVGGQPVCTFIDKKTGVRERINFSFGVKKFVRYGNRLFGVTDQGLTEFNFHKFKQVVASAKVTWNALPGTEWWDGFGLQNALHAMYLICPYGDDACAHIRIPELDGVTVLSGVRGQRSLALVGVTKKGDMMRYNIHCTRDYVSYSINANSVDVSDIVQVTLASGVIVEITDDGKLEARAEGSANFTTVEDGGIFLDGELYQKRNTVLYVRKGDVWSITMR